LVSDDYFFFRSPQPILFCTLFKVFCNPRFLVFPRSTLYRWRPGVTFLFFRLTTLVSPFLGVLSFLTPTFPLRFHTLHNVSPLPFLWEISVLCRWFPCFQQTLELRNNPLLATAFCTDSLELTYVRHHHLSKLDVCLSLPLRLNKPLTGSVPPTNTFIHVANFHPPIFFLLLCS